MEGTGLDDEHFRIGDDMIPFSISDKEATKFRNVIGEVNRMRQVG